MWCTAYCIDLHQESQKICSDQKACEASSSIVTPNHEHTRHIEEFEQNENTHCSISLLRAKTLEDAPREAQNAPTRSTRPGQSQNEENTFFGHIKEECTHVLHVETTKEKAGNIPCPRHLKSKFLCCLKPMRQGDLNCFLLVCSNLTSVESCPPRQRNRMAKKVSGPPASPVENRLCPGMYQMLCINMHYICH